MLSGPEKDNYDIRLTGNGVKLYDLADFLARQDNLKRIESKVVTPLTDLKAVCYYGCMANRPPKVTESPDYENPVDMDNIAKTMGVDVKPWSYKTDCCGASFSLSRQDIVFTLVKKLYDRALEAGAQSIIVSCQMCHANLDLYQNDISERFGQKYSLPVFYMTELIGLGLGLPGVSTWLGRHRVNPIPFLKRKGIRI